MRHGKHIALLEKETMSTSRAVQYLDTKGWAYKASGVNPNQLIVETCPLCSNTGWHFYLLDDGACPYDCKKCQAQGTLYELRKELGEVMDGVISYKTDQPTTFPDIERAHQALLDDAAALTYLTQTRGFLAETIKRCKLARLGRRR